MTQLSNQFKQSDQLGRLDLSLPGGQTWPVQVHSSQATALVPGDPLTVYDTARGGIIQVVKAAANTDQIFGYVPYNQKESSYAAGSRFEAAGAGAVIVLRATAAFARLTHLMIDLGATGGVKTATGGKAIIGWAVDKADADADLVRVCLFLPAAFIA